MVFVNSLASSLQLTACYVFFLQPWTGTMFHFIRGGGNSLSLSLLSDTCSRYFSSLAQQYLSLIISTRNEMISLPLTLEMMIWSVMLFSLNHQMRPVFLFSSHSPERLRNRRKDNEITRTTRNMRQDDLLSSDWVKLCKSDNVTATAKALSLATFLLLVPHCCMSVC